MKMENEIYLQKLQSSLVTRLSYTTKIKIAYKMEVKSKAMKTSHTITSSSVHSATPKEKKNTSSFSFSKNRPSAIQGKSATSSFSEDRQ